MRSRVMPYSLPIESSVRLSPFPESPNRSERTRFERSGSSFKSSFVMFLGEKESIKGRFLAVFRLIDGRSIRCFCYTKPLFPCQTRSHEAVFRAFYNSHTTAHTSKRLVCRVKPALFPHKNPIPSTLTHQGDQMTGGKITLMVAQNLLPVRENEHICRMINSSKYTL